MTLGKFKIGSTHTFVAMRAGNYYNKSGERWWLLIFSYADWVFLVGDLEFGLKAGNRVKYNNLNYRGVHVTNRCSILAAAHMNLEHSGRGETLSPWL